MRGQAVPYLLWRQVTLVIDAALLQHEIILGAVGPADYQQGSSLFQFKVRCAMVARCVGRPQQGSTALSVRV